MLQVRLHNNLTLTPHQVQSGLGDAVHQRRKHLQSLLAVGEDHHVVADQLVALDVDSLVREELQLRLCCFAVIQAEVVAGFEVHADGTLRVGLQVHRQDLQGHVVVVQLVVAHRHVHVQRQVVSVLQQQALVNIRVLYTTHN